MAKLTKEFIEQLNRRCYAPPAETTERIYHRMLEIMKEEGCSADRAHMKALKELPPTPGEKWVKIPEDIEPI